MDAKAESYVSKYGKRTLVIYCRVSTPRQMHSGALSVQQLSCQHYAMKRGWYGHIVMREIGPRHSLLPIRNAAMTVAMGERFRYPMLVEHYDRWGLDNWRCAYEFFEKVGVYSVRECNLPKYSTFAKLFYAVG